MANTNTQTTTKPGNTKGTREAWTITCVNAGLDCSFAMTNHNQKQLVNFTLNHLKETHNLVKTDKDVLALCKTTKW